MALFTNLQSLSQTAGANPPDGSADAPSTIPTDLRLLGSFDAIMRDGGHQWGSSVGGTNTISITVNGISSLVAGQVFRFVAAGANTGAVTLNVNSLGAKSVLKYGTSALVAGDIANLSTVVAAYDGTNFQLANVAAAPDQAWQDLTASRAINTTYTNSTGRPITASASVQGTVATSTVAIAWTVGGVGNISSNSLITGAAAGNTTLSAVTVVPSGATYSLQVTQGALSAWRELR